VHQIEEIVQWIHDFFHELCRKSVLT